MKLSEFRMSLEALDSLQFSLPDGKLVPPHFHVTEIGRIDKTFIDCGGVQRTEHKASLQLWTSSDAHHRLAPSKLAQIIDLATPLFAGKDPEIEIEYQLGTIGKFGLGLSTDAGYALVALQTDCLAKDDCGVPDKKAKLSLAELGDNTTCTPGSGCC